MLKTRTLEYVHMEDICKLFNCNMRDFSFIDGQANDSFFYLPCDDFWIQETLNSIKSVASGTRSEKKYYNTLKVQEYVRKVMKQDGIFINISW